MEQVIHFILDTAGIGGLILSGVLGTAVLTYVLLTRWILQGGREEGAPSSRGTFRLPWRERQ